MAHDDLVCPPPVPACSHPACRLALCAQTVRRWVLKFGPLFARELRNRRPRPTLLWHLDEMAVMIAGTQFWLWRAVDDEGEVLDLLVQRRRDQGLAIKLMRKLLKKRTRSAGDGQAALLRRGKVRNGIVGSPRAGPAQKQSGREFASTDTTARAQDAALQIAGISPALAVHSRRRSQHIQRPAPSHIPPHSPRPQRRSVPDVANCHRGLNRAGPS
jgi:hypothetical protein